MRLRARLAAGLLVFLCAPAHASVDICEQTFRQFYASRYYDSAKAESGNWAGSGDEYASAVLLRLADAVADYTYVVTHACGHK